MNFVASALRQVDEHGWRDRPAFHAGGSWWTHGEVHDLAAGLAGELAARSVSAGQRVVVAQRDGIGLVATFLAVARLGATAVLANPLLTAPEHGHIAADSGAVLAVADEDVVAHFPGIGVDAGEVLDGARTREPLPPKDVPPDEPLYIQYTSGTTGTPKGVVHAHEDPVLYHRLVGEGVFHVGPDDVHLSLSKLYFAYGFGNALAFPLMSGSSAVLIPERPTPEDIRAAVERHRVTLLYAVPSAYAKLVRQGNPEEFRSIRAAVSAGEPLTPELGERAGALLSAPVLDQLGCTEVGHAFCANTVTHNTPGSLGVAVPGYELEVRDENGEDVGPGGEGELWVRGPTLLRGYLNRPEATAEVLVDGWFNTRDRVTTDEGGHVWYLGRTDDLEMVGGITVSPVEIEMILSRHGGIAECAVMSVPDEDGASKLRAFVVPKADQDLGVLEEELISAARAELAPYKVPRSVTVLAEGLPRTDNGKLSRTELRDRVLRGPLLPN
ncbi:AMP-binding protein [Saccharopolyspora taberi]|uniref:Acyl-CoA synthase n=1 Tax=Saccharopolyspora taberi TaxID=60895 RepID=A0ABN3V6E7_9PSEU